MSREVIVMVESEKIGRKIPNLELSWDSIDILITNKDLAPELKLSIESQGVKKFFVPKNNRLMTA